MRATCDPGDEVILHEPSYVAYIPAIVFAGGKPVLVPTRVERRLRARSGGRRGGHHAADEGPVPGLPVQPDRRRAAATRSRPSWPTSPSATTCSCTATRSTTGWCTATTATRRSARCRHARPDDPHRRLLEGVRDDRLAGRLRGARRAGILEGLVKVHQYGIMSAPTTAQDAALVAVINGPRQDVERMVDEYDRRRRMFVEGLNAIGLPTFEPRGAFYAFPDIARPG